MHKVSYFTGYNSLSHLQLDLSISLKIKSNGAAELPMCGFINVLIAYGLTRMSCEMQAYKTSPVYCSDIISKFHKKLN